MTAIPLEPVGTSLGKWGGLDSLNQQPPPLGGRRYINATELVEHKRTLTVWVSFGGAGWLPVWTVEPDPELPDVRTLVLAPEWSGPEPYDAGAALAEVLLILAGLGR